MVTAEIGPPKGTAGRAVREKAELLRTCTDAVNLTDNQTAVVRLSSIAAAVHVLQAGGEPIIQMTCRDRNRIGIQSDLLGAASLGIRNVLCLAGDHQSLGNHPEATGVYDLDTAGLISTIRRLRDEGCFLSGDPLTGDPPLFYIGAAANPLHEPPARLHRKIEAGADFFQTQAVYDLEALSRWFDAAREEGILERAPILVGVIPPRSPRMLENLSRVPGIVIPEGVRRRLQEASDFEAESLVFTAELIAAIRSLRGPRGVHIMAVAWEKIVPELVRTAGLLPRPQAETWSGATSRAGVN